MEERISVDSEKSPGKRQVSLALCGFGRAGKIHFSGIRANHRCRLKYIVDCFDIPEVLETVRAVLDEHRMQLLTQVHCTIIAIIIYRDFVKSLNN